MTAPLTALEKTMTSEQLKEAGHPAWARGYTVDYLRLCFIMADNLENERRPYGFGDVHPHEQRTEDLKYVAGNI